jgi:hypothetical protein
MEAVSNIFLFLKMLLKTVYLEVFSYLKRNLAWITGIDFALIF